LTFRAVDLSGHHFMEDAGMCPLPLRSTAFPAVFLIPRWLVPSYTLPGLLATSGFIQQVFSLYSSMSGRKWTDSHWKAAKHLSTLHSRGHDLCLTFDGNGESGSTLRYGEADWPPHAAMPCCSTAIVGPRRALLFLRRLGFDGSFLPQPLSVLFRFNRQTKLYHHQYIHTTTTA
jgi:hypothetical protein